MGLPEVTHDLTDIVAYDKERKVSFPNVQTAVPVVLNRSQRSTHVKLGHETYRPTPNQIYVVSASTLGR